MCMEELRNWAALISAVVNTVTLEQVGSGAILLLLNDMDKQSIVGVGGQENKGNLSTCCIDSAEKWHE